MGKYIQFNLSEDEIIDEVDKIWRVVVTAANMLGISRDDPACEEVYTDYLVKFMEQKIIKTSVKTTYLHLLSLKSRTPVSYFNEFQFD